MATSIKDYKNLQNTLEEKLYSNPGTTSPGSEVDYGALNAQVQLMKTKTGLKRVLSQQRANDWYGSENLPTAGMKPKEGIVMKSLNTLLTPLYSIVGAAETLLGKGTEKGLWSNVKSNVKERGTFGDLLRSYDLPNIVSIPAGFALDVAFDPVTWVTMGTSALIPKIAVGAAKAGVEGAALGAKAGLVSKAFKIGKFVPGVKKTEVYQSLGKKAINLADRYDVATGRNVGEILQRAIDNPNFYQKSGAEFEKLLRSTFGNQAVDSFKYSNKKEFARWVEAENAEKGLRDNAINFLKGTGEADKVFLPVGKSGELPEGALTGIDVQSIIQRGVADGEKVLNTAGKLVAKNPDDVAKAMAQEAKLTEEFTTMVRERIKELNKVEMGPMEKWSENLKSAFGKVKVGDVAVGENIVNGLNVFTNMFKVSKVSIPGSSYMNAIVGNPIMALMSGVQIWRPSFWKSVAAAKKIISGKGGQAEIKALLENPQIAEFLTRNPDVFSRAFGIHPNFIKALDAGEEVVSELADEAMKAGVKIDFGQAADVGATIKKGKEALLNSGAYGKQIRDKFGSVITRTIKGEEERGGLFAQEIFGETQVGFNKFIKELEVKASKGNSFAKWAHWYFTKPMDWYQQIDQSFKLGTFMHFAQEGVPESTLMMMKNFFPIAAKDVERVEGAGEVLYKLSPLKAAEASGEIFMNYGAMPDFVRMMRSFPLMGAPFISFTYAMASKLGKTLKYNPAVFNKVNLALTEIAGGKTPLEKENLKSPYNQFLNRPGQVKLNAMFPFLGDNPIYLNMMNMLPHYTLNMLQPQEREYLDPKTKAITQLRDKLPIMQMPEGQIVWDYFIQPLILMHSNPPEEPVGAFNQPLYPESASPLEKYGTLPLRGVAESLTPAAASPLAAFAGSLPDKAVDYLPNYRWREMAFAVQGKGTTGIQGTEPALQRTLRALSATFGLPWRELKLRFPNKSNQ